MPTTAPLQAAQATLRHHFSVDEYYRMAETGILPEGQAVELLEGEIYTMSPVNSPHASCVKKITRLLYAALEQNAYLVSVQDPIRLDAHTEPEPDLAVLRYRADFYQHAHPSPQDVFLIVEVSDSSLHKDLTIKLPLYAKAGIPEVWIVNLSDNTLAVYHQPANNAYGQHTVYHPADAVQSGCLGAFHASEVLN